MMNVGVTIIQITALMLCPYVSSSWIIIGNTNNGLVHVNSHRVVPTGTSSISTSQLFATSLSGSKRGSLHGENACFLPLKQYDQDSFSPRIVQIAGPYPGLSKEDFLAVQSEPAAPQGQWTYDFSDPDGPQLGTVAIEGSQLVADCADPVVVIAEHTAIGVQLPAVIKEPVDLVVLIDRAKNRYNDRRFLVLNVPGEDELTIAAFNAKSEIPPGSEILGQVELVQVPWLPSMTPTRTGFMESDEYY